MRRLAPLLALLALTGACSTTTFTDRPAADCASLVPDEWRKGVAGEPLPGSAATVGDWESFGDGLAGDLDVANNREQQTLGIVSKCEARDAALVSALNRHKLFGVF